MKSRNQKVIINYYLSCIKYCIFLFSLLGKNILMKVHLCVTSTSAGRDWECNSSKTLALGLVLLVHFVVPSIY